MATLQKNTKQKIDVPWLYGFNQVQALLAKRPKDMRVILYHQQRRYDLGPLLQCAASQRLPYREVPDEELTAASGSIHHEGVCVKAVLPPILPVEEALSRKLPFILAFDRVTNPHNVGAIMRSAAYFGVSGVLFSEDRDQALLSPAVLRTAEGGGEYIPSFLAKSLGRAQVEFKRRGYTIVGADARSPISIYEKPLTSPCVLIVGNEAQGLSETVRSRCDWLASIPGAGQVDSLNVSVATAILLAEALRPGTRERGTGNSPTKTERGR
jgi:TrmH RNA methyltransferase